MQFSALDIIVFAVYLIVIIGIGLYVSREKKGHQKNAEDYFLAGKSLPWMDQMLYTLIITMVTIAGVSRTSSADIDDPKGIPLTALTFKTDSTFNIGAYTVITILALLYTIFW